MSDTTQTDKIKEICDACGELFEKLGITATIVIKHPDIADEFSFQNCHFYDAAKMVAKAHANIKEQISQDILT